MLSTFKRVAVALATAGGCVAGNAVAETIDFKTLGTFNTASFTQGALTLTAEQSVGVAGQLHILNFNGVGVVGGTSDTVVDPGEALLFRFPDGQVTGVTISRSFLRDGNANGQFGETTIEGFYGTTSRGTATISGFNADISALFAGQPLTGFTARAVEGDRLSTVSFTFSAITRHWINPQSGYWSEAANWTLSGVPGAGSPVVIDPVGGVRVTGPFNNTVVDSLTIGALTSGVAVLEIGYSDLQVTKVTTIQSRGAVEIAGNQVLRAQRVDNSGVIRGSGQVDAPLANATTGRVTAGTGQRLEFTGAGASSNDGTIEANGGEIAFTGLLKNQKGTGMITGRDAILRFNGGLDNGGSLALTAGLSDVHGDIVNAGTMALGARAQAIFHDDVKQSGTFIIPTAASATMLGEYSGGGFTGGGELVILGDLRPGFSPAVTTFGGDLTLGASALTEIDIEGLIPGEFDQGLVAGHLTLDGTLAVLLGGGFGLDLGQSFLIFTADGGVSGQFAGLADGAVVGTFGGRELFIDYAANSVALYTAPVPEPGTYALLLAGLAAMGFIGRRRVLQG